MDNHSAPKYIKMRSGGEINKKEGINMNLILNIISVIGYIIFIIFVFLGMIYATYFMVKDLRQEINTHQKQKNAPK